MRGPYFDAMSLGAEMKRTYRGQARASSSKQRTSGSEKRPSRLLRRNQFWPVPTCGMSNKCQRPATEANGSMLVWWVKRCQMNYSLRIYHLLKYCILILSKDITYYVQICLLIFIQIEYYLKTDFLFKNNFYSKLIGKCGLDFIRNWLASVDLIQSRNILFLFKRFFFIKHLQLRMENCPTKSIFDHNFSEKEMTDMNFAMYPEHGVCSLTQTQHVLVTKLAGISSMLLTLARFHSLASVRKWQGYIRQRIQTHTHSCQRKPFGWFFWVAVSLQDRFPQRDPWVLRTQSKNIGLCYNTYWCVFTPSSIG